MRLRDLVIEEQARYEYARYLYATGHLNDFDGRDADGRRLADPDVRRTVLIHPSPQHSLAAIRTRPR